MSLERKDVRLKLDPDDHAVVKLVAESHGLDMDDWAEAVLVREARREFHRAMVLAKTAQRLGIDGKAIPERPQRRGMAGSVRE